MSYVTRKLEIGDWVARRRENPSAFQMQYEYRVVAYIANINPKVPHRVWFTSMELEEWLRQGIHGSVILLSETYPDDNWEIVGPIALTQQEYEDATSGHKIPAIKSVRDRMKCGLYLAKACVDYAIRQPFFTAHQKPKEDEQQPFAQCPKCDHVFSVDFGLFPIEPFVLEEEDEEENQEA